MRTDRPGRHVIVHMRGFFEKQPARIEGHDGHAWYVENVDAYWEHEDARTRGKGQYGAEFQKWMLTVTGPMPGRPHESGEQQVTLTSYGDGAGWWMLPGHQPGPGNPSPTPSGT